MSNCLTCLYRCLKLQAVTSDAAQKHRVQVFDLIAKGRQFDIYLRVLSFQKIVKGDIPADLREVVSPQNPNPPFQQIFQLLNTNHAATSSMMVGVLDLIEQLCELADVPQWRFMGSACKLLWSLLLVRHIPTEYMAVGFPSPSVFSLCLLTCDAYLLLCHTCRCDTTMDYSCVQCSRAGCST